MHRAGFKHRANDFISATIRRNRQYASEIRTTNYGYKSCNNIYNTTINLSTFDAHASTSQQSITNADETDANPSTVVEFTGADSANEFCQNAYKNLGQIRTELSLNKKGALVRRAHIYEALQKLMPQ